MTTQVSDTDIENLLFMRQEEKLAGDVYHALFEKWELAPFSNIEESELFHQSEVSGQLARLGVEDKADELAPGEFSIPKLQDLYHQLVERGTQSVEEAYRVGALIEEIDIDDLRKRRCGVPEIDALYELLELGSYNHLRAFIINLAYMELPYKVQVLTPQEVVDILQAGGGGCDSNACHGAAGAAHHDDDNSCV